MRTLRLKFRLRGHRANRFAQQSPRLLSNKRAAAFSPKAAGISVAIAALALCGCNAPGHPKPGPEVPRPDQIVSFNTLFSQNCSACHGATGENGPSYPIANPVFQAMVTPAILHSIISEGDPGTSMPPFSVKYGGLLTSKQIDVLVAGIRKRWYKPEALAGQVPPPYAPTHAGDPVLGKKLFEVNCAICHGMPPDGVSRSRDIFNPNFLSLVSDEVLRTIVVAGRPDLGMPDWRGDIPGSQNLHMHLTDQNVTDIVAWLATLRPMTPISQSGTPPVTAPVLPPASNKATTKASTTKTSKRAGGPNQ